MLGRKKKRASYHHGDLRRALLAGALVRIHEQSADFSLRALGQDLGVDPAAIYRHFEDRAALLRAVADEGLARLADRMQGEMNRTDDAALRLIAVGEAYVRFALAEPGLFRLMFGPLTTRGSAPPARAHLLLQEALLAVVPNPPPGAAVAAWSLVHGLAILLLDGRVTYDVDATLAAVLPRMLATVATES